MRHVLKNQRVVLFNTAMSHPRYQRRANMFNSAGMRVRMYTFEREWYADNLNFAPGVEVVKLGRMRAGNYAKRLPELWKAAKMVRTLERKEADPAALAYAFELDSALIMSLAMEHTVPRIYEVGDLRNPEPTLSLATRLIYAVERSVVKRVNGFVVTSPGYITEYYTKMDSTVTDKGIVIENKLPSNFLELFSRPSNFRPSRPIRIGLIGLLRYPETVLPLIEAVSEREGEFELHCFGDGPLKPTIADRAKAHTNVFYHGPYKNPHDLERVYSSIDLNYLAYNNANLNIRLALPNRLYESIFFGRPMVVPCNTLVAEWVEKYGIGFVVNPANSSFVKEFLDELSLEDLTKRGSQTLALPASLAIQDDNESLSEIIKLVKPCA